MTAKEFTERFGYKLDSIKENNLITQENSASGDYACAIGDTSTKEVVGGVLFSAKNEESITYNQGSTQKISLITAIVYNSEDGARVLLGTIITLDPSLSIEEGLDVGEAILKAAASGKTYTKNNISYAVIVQGGSTYIMASAK